MQVKLNKSELEKFVIDKVQHGDFPSAEAVVEDALTRMMEEEQTLTAEDIAAISQAEQEMDRGEHVEFDAFADAMRTVEAKTRLA